jgi:hypothetical protein
MLTKKMKRRIMNFFQKMETNHCSIHNCRAIQNRNLIPSEKGAKSEGADAAASTPDLFHYSIERQAPLRAAEGSPA